MIFIQYEVKFFLIYEFKGRVYILIILISVVSLDVSTFGLWERGFVVDEWEFSGYNIDKFYSWSG